jgi:(1->4)-alpha-D-glucan 1-alpha-D-glucosylmutase
LFAGGVGAERVVAFARTGLVCAVPRLGLGLAGWGDTELELPPGRHRDVFSGEIFSGGTVSVAKLFARFPVALLSSEEGSET